MVALLSSVNQGSASRNFLLQRADRGVTLSLFLTRLITMCVLILSDIFGRTAALDQLALALDRACQILDPYGGTPRCFDSENAAYTFFQQTVGIDQYLADATLALKNSCTKVDTVIGFSVGATVAWRLMAEVQGEKTDRAICFYGSQIRHYNNLQPRHAVTLIHPREEPHFAVEELQAALDQRANVQQISTPYLHGFMNQLSKNFDADGHDQYVAWLNTQLSV